MASSTTGPEAAPSPGTIRKVLIAACAASSIEWYDFFIYLTAAAPVFPALFFPSRLCPGARGAASRRRPRLVFPAGRRPGGRGAALVQHGGCWLLCPSSGRRAFWPLRR